MALTTLNLSGIKAGDSLNISVSQGGLTAGPYSVGSWGGGGDGGTIAIQVLHRSYRQIAPDSVHLEVDLSQSNFDTPGPGAGEFYDPRMHDIYYFWDLGDPGTWDEPVNVLASWKNRNVAKGPKVRHLYRDPGTYTASVFIVEPSSGKTATAQVTFDVGDPQDFYGDANTIYVNNVNDNDWSYVPAGVPSGNKINVDSITVNESTVDAAWATFQGGHAKRWRFKRGGTWKMEIFLTRDEAPDVMFDAYGDPADSKPVWLLSDAITTAKAGTMIRMSDGHEYAAGRDRALTPPELRLWGLRFQGGFDATATWALDPASERSTFFWPISSCEVVMVDCEVDGFGGTIIAGQFGVGSDYSGTGKIHVDNCAISNFGGEYQFTSWNTATPQSAITFTGVRFEQPGDAVSSGKDPTTNFSYLSSRSLARISATQFVHMRGCDMFMLDKDLGHLQLGKNAREDGYTYNIHSCSAEMGSHFIGTDGGYATTPQQRGHVHNGIIDSVVYVAGWNAQQMVALDGVGYTVRNCLFIVPAVDRIANGVVAFVEINEANATGSPLPDFVANAPIKVYNNTFLVLRTALQNSIAGNWKPQMVENNWPALTAVSEHNNLMHMPNYSIAEDPEAPYLVYAPVTENILWTPRCLGYRQPWDNVLKTEYATPLDTVRDTKPAAGSAAIGAALTNDVAYDSLGDHGTARGGSPAIGAWQVS